MKLKIQYYPCFATENPWLKQVRIFPNEMETAVNRQIYNKYYRDGKIENGSECAWLDKERISAKLK